jgi:AAA family ATP:ADP antiporter
VQESAEASYAVAVQQSPDLDREQFLQTEKRAFYGDFFSVVNVLTILIQALLVSRLVKYFGLRGVLFTLPLISLIAYGSVALGAAFVVLRWAKTAENSTDYSVMNTGRALLWLPTTRDEKYKAKQAIDTFVVRVGDLLSTALVYLGTETMALSRGGFAYANVVLIAAWLAITALVVREYRNLSQQGQAGAL